MRISVSLIVSLVAKGMSVDEIVREYPDQALGYAAWVADENVYPPVGRTA